MIAKLYLGPNEFPSWKNVKLSYFVLWLSETRHQGGGFQHAYMHGVS